MGFRKVCFFFVWCHSFSYTDHQAFELLIKLKRAYRKYNTRLTRWLDILSHFDISMEHTVGKQLQMTDFLSRHPTEETSTEETYGKECAINILSDFARTNHK